MVIDWSFTVGNLLTLMAMIAGGVTMYVGHVRVLDSVRHDAAQARQRADEAYSTATSAVKLLGDWRLDVEKNFATNSSLAAVEDRIVKAIDKLGDRIDRAMSKG